MKKVILFIIGIISIIIPGKVFAGTNDTVIDWDLDRSIFVHRMINGKYHLTNMPFLTANGNVVYCIEPGKELEKGGTMSSTANKNDTGITRNMDKVSLIGYYGYKKFGHNDPKYYLAAQKLIWLETGAQSVKYTYDREGNNVIDIAKEEMEILGYANSYNRLPKLDFKSSYLVGEEVTLEDKNNVLKDFEISHKNADVAIDGNNIKLKVSNNNAFFLKRKVDDTKTVYYYKPGLQTVASFGVPYVVGKNYSITPIYGKITLNKMDFDTKKSEPYNKDVTLKDAEYTLYDENGNELQKRFTDEKGTLVFDRLPKGNYIIRETKASKGYNLSLDSYTVKIDNNNIDANINVYEKVIKGKIKITKLLSDYDNKKITFEKNISFEVYDPDNNLIDTKTTDENGELVFKLAYGNYIIKQKTVLSGISKAKDFKVTIDEQDKTLEYTLINHVLEKPKTKKSKIINTLPRTGKKSSIPVLIALLILLIVKYEKKNI